MRKRIIPILIAILVLTGITYLWRSSKPPEVQAVATQAAIITPTVVSAHAPDVLTLADDPLKQSIISAGEYLVRQQLANGELAYQVNLLTNDRSSTPSNIRLMGGVSTLYTVCRVAGDSSYCDAADLALEHYLPNLLADPNRFKGACLYTNGACPLGGAAITVDSIYKRWLATGSVTLNDHNLLEDAVDSGYFIVSMRRAQGGLYHSFDPHAGGMVDPNYFDPTFNGEAAVALLQLYEMTANEFWLEQAHEINAFMLVQAVTEDSGHAYALALFARLDALSQADQAYAQQIADLIVAGQIRSLNPLNSSFSTAAKVEALASIAQALTLSAADPAPLEREIKSFITFVRARQFPANDCNFDISSFMIEQYQGGLFNACADPSIRVDGVQHWVNGLTLYLEYEGMREK